MNGIVLFRDHFSDELKREIGTFIIRYSQLEHVLVLVCKRLKVQVDSATSLANLLQHFSGNRRGLLEELHKLLDRSSPVPELLSVKQKVAELVDEYASIAVHRHMVCHGLWADFIVGQPGDEKIYPCLIQYDDELRDSPTIEDIQLWSARCTELTLLLNGMIPANFTIATPASTAYAAVRTT